MLPCQKSNEDGIVSSPIALTNTLSTGIAATQFAGITRFATYCTWAPTAWNASNTTNSISSTLYRTRRMRTLEAADAALRNQCARNGSEMSGARAGNCTRTVKRACNRSGGRPGFDADCETVCGVRMPSYLVNPLEHCKRQRRAFRSRGLKPVRHSTSLPLG